MKEEESFFIYLPSGSCFLALLGTIQWFAYPPPPGFRLCWVRFAPLLTLHHLVFGLAGYDSLFYLPSTTWFSAWLGTIRSFAYPPPPGFRLCWVRFALLLTLHHLVFGSAGYDSLFCLPYNSCFPALPGMILPLNLLRRSAQKNRLIRHNSEQACRFP